MPENIQQLFKIAVPAGLLAGTVMGLIARVAMRLFALADGSKPTFSIGGTAAVIFIFAVILGIPLALVYVRFWRPLGMAAGLHGPAYGALLFVVLIAIPFMIIPSDEATLRIRLMAIAAFFPVPLTYGFALGRFAEGLLNRL